MLMRLGNISPRRSSVGDCEWDDDADGDDARRTSYEGKRTSREKSVWPRAPTITVDRRSHVVLFVPAGRSFQFKFSIVFNKCNSRSFPRVSFFITISSRVTSFLALYLTFGNLGKSFSTFLISGFFLLSVCYFFHEASSMGYSERICEIDRKIAATGAFYFFDTP